MLDKIVVAYVALAVSALTIRLAASLIAIHRNPEDAEKAADVHGSYFSFVVIYVLVNLVVFSGFVIYAEISK